MALRMVCALGALLALAGCYQGSSDSLRDSVSASGVSVEIWGNLPFDGDSAQVAASVYLDADKKALVGGDVVKAYSESDSAILRSLENLSGDYSAEVAIINSGAGLHVAVEHDPVGAREDRWYPVDELLVDPGPGELVGYNVDLAFPAAVIRDPSPVNGTIYSDRADAIDLSWTVAVSDPAQQMRMTAVRECFSGDRSVKWATSSVIGTGDPGSYSVTVGQLIPDTGLLTTALDFVAQLTVIIVGELLQEYTFGLLNPESISFDSFVIDHCDISITVFREIPGTLGPGISGGYAIASTSETFHLVFEPL